MKQAYNVLLEKIDQYRFRIPASYKSGMRVPGIIYANDRLIEDIRKDNALDQVVNVSYLPGIIKYSLAMPDIHWGYGFPIGGVAATDPSSDGVISPGGVGYDINCLSPDSEILTSYGYTRKIKDLEQDFKNANLTCMDLDKKTPTETKIKKYIKISTDKQVFKVKTYSGKEIIATEDHPFWTLNGMKSLNRLREGELVSVYPFEGISYEKPTSRIIVDKKDIEKVFYRAGKKDRGNALIQIKRWFEKIDLLPLKYNSWQLPYLLKIIGYVFGDGYIYFNNKEDAGITWFYGKGEDLEKIRKDILKLGFKPSKIYSRKKNHKFKTLYSEYEFNNIETSFKVCSSSFAILLVALGAPLGNKAAQNYSLPDWIFKAPLWQKRLFLASFFGAEMSTPKTIINHKYNFYAPVISMNKKDGYVKSGKQFFKDLSSLLNDFGIPIVKISQRMEYVNSNNEISYHLRLILSNTPEAMINLYSKVGFEYNARRSFIANVVIHYLKMKQRVCKQRQEVAVYAEKLHEETGKSARDIYNEMGRNGEVNLRFIERSIYGGRKTVPRVAFDTLGFTEFLERHTRGLDDSGMVWDEIISREEIKYNDYVYDFTVQHPDHNFVANNFVVSNCGVRLVKTDLELNDVRSKLRDLVVLLYNNIPAGVGSSGVINLSQKEERQILLKGSRWAVDRGYGTDDDIEHTEERGCMDGADPDTVSQRAYQRGRKQPGTLGSGNHFLEVQVIDSIFDKEIANCLGIFKGQVMVMVHSGSRGFGYQVCDDYLKGMGKTSHKYGIDIPDRQLACAPVNSSEGQSYIKAMKCAANYAWVNRQCLMHFTREVFEKFFNKSWQGIGMKLIYDVAHNIAKFETHDIDGKIKKVCVHRKGATRALPPGHSDLPIDYKDIGQPVIIPGDMGTYSYLLVGTKKASETFYSTCHGAGRVMSRTQAIKSCYGKNISQELKQKGIIVMATGRNTLAEEIPDAYKDVNEVVDVVEGAGISKKVCRMKPVGVIKG